MAAELTPAPVCRARVQDTEARSTASRQKIERVLAAANEFEVLELEVKFTSAADVEKAYK